MVQYQYQANVRDLFKAGMQNPLWSKTDFTAHVVVLSYNKFSAKQVLFMAFLSEMAFDLSTLCLMKLKKTQTVRFMSASRLKGNFFGSDEKKVNVGLGVLSHTFLPHVLLTGKFSKCKNIH